MAPLKRKMRCPSMVTARESYPTRDIDIDRYTFLPALKCASWTGGCFRPSHSRTFSLSTLPKIVADGKPFVPFPLSFKYRLFFGAHTLYPVSCTRFACGETRTRRKKELGRHPPGPPPRAAPSQPASEAAPKNLYL